MKIKLDENVTSRLVPFLLELGHDVDTVYLEGLAGASDRDIWAVAQEESRFLITQDLDFSDNRKFIPGSHYGVLLLRLRDPGRTAIFECIRRLYINEDVASWKGCFVVVTERKVRIRYPSGHSIERSVL